MSYVLVSCRTYSVATVTAMLSECGFGKLTSWLLFYVFVHIQIMLSYSSGMYLHLKSFELILIFGMCFIFYINLSQEHTPAVDLQTDAQANSIVTIITPDDLKVTVERDLVSQAEEADMEALLGRFVSLHSLGTHIHL